MNLAATINPNVGVEQARTMRELLRAQIATNQALSSVTETCRELQGARRGGPGSRRTAWTSLPRARSGNAAPAARVAPLGMT